MGSASESTAAAAGQPEQKTPRGTKQRRESGVVDDQSSKRQKASRRAIPLPRQSLQFLVRKFKGIELPSELGALRIARFRADHLLDDARSASRDVPYFDWCFESDVAQIVVGFLPIYEYGVYNFLWFFSEDSPFSTASYSAWLAEANQRSKVVPTCFGLEMWTPESRDFVTREEMYLVPPAVRHCETGPALMWASAYFVSLSYKIHDSCHRVDGPASIEIITARASETNEVVPLAQPEVTLIWALYGTLYKTEEEWLSARAVLCPAVRGSISPDASDA